MAEVEVWRGSVAAWECDGMGHLNVGFYVAKSMQALGGMAAELAMPGAFAPAAEATLMVREQHIRFLREARPGAPLSITARVRAMAEQLMTEVPSAAAPRSIGLDPVVTRASLKQAEAMGLKRTGLGIVSAHECDPFGRMRTEGFMHRLSDAVPHLFAEGRPGKDEADRRVGGAAMEYRLMHHAWPRAGDRMEMRSGSAGGDARFRRLVHWLLDPATGKPWGSAEAMAVSFDLDTRKIIALSDAELARVNAQAIEGLSL